MRPKKDYKKSVDKSGSQYCGFIVKWNYAKKYVDISMPGYVDKALHKFQHPSLKKPQYAPHGLNQSMVQKSSMSQLLQHYQYLIKKGSRESSQSQELFNITLGQ